jgi:hypothetical protein
MSRVPQLDDDVRIVVTLPPSTEEWAEDLLEDMAVEIERDDEGLYITEIVGGNCNAVANAASFLRDLEEAFQEGDIDPMEFTLTASTVAR